MGNRIDIDGIWIGEDAPFVLIAGPCVIEDSETTFSIASYLTGLTEKLDIPFIFKASYDKANRTALDSYRGPGITNGLMMLQHIKREFGIAVLSDVHQVDEVHKAAEVLDVIQIPAFLCRQTDLILAAAGTGKPVNLKKGQFLAPWDMENAVKKVESTGNRKIMLTERGSTFGYNNLVVDFRSIGIMRRFGYPVVFDATHSVQLPGGAGKRSGGQREFAPILARSAVAAGADGIFIEVHIDPEKALCDGPNSLKLGELENLLTTLTAIRRAVKG
ncbi:MAG: 3-deoxy-8-phosphooctulonate synthase [Desulfobacterales bacterium]